MKIAILASEGAPYIKSGGLGDVMEALPSALARIPGNEVTLILPYYKKILAPQTPQRSCPTLRAHGGAPRKILPSPHDGARSHTKTACLHLSFLLSP